MAPGGSPSRARLPSTATVSPRWRRSARSLQAPAMLPKISQGVTTVVAGNCGISLAPATFTGDPPAPMNLLGGSEAYCFPSFAAYAAAVKKAAPSINVAALVGHSALRLATMNDVSRKARAKEIEAMLAH